MKDSEAACATLGLNLLGTKLMVFAISAGIAGLGGALYAMQLTSIQPGNFDLVNSLQIFALTVVGGIGAVGGALFGAASLYVAAAAPRHAAARPSPAGSCCSPAVPASALGRNPNGAVHDIREGFAPLLRSPARPRGAWCVALAAIYGLRLADVIDNWTFVDPLRRRDPARRPASRRCCSRGRRGGRRRLRGRARDVPLEWRGIDRPWTDDDVTSSTATSD